MNTTSSDCQMATIEAIQAVVRCLYSEYQIAGLDTQLQPGLKFTASIKLVVRGTQADKSITLSGQIDSIPRQRAEIRRATLQDGQREDVVYFQVNNNRLQASLALLN